MAEGIAGIVAGSAETVDGSRRSFLEELQEGGKQMVKITAMLKKNTELMYPKDIPGLKYLDDYVNTTGSSNTYVKWCDRYLRAKVEE